MNCIAALKKPFLVVFIALITILPMSACTNASRQNNLPAKIPPNMQWWTDARFGMFIHWGPVSLKGTEIGWSRGTTVPREEYDGLYKRFNATEFDAAKWVRVAKQAGMKYIIITSKHHDGFCIWDTKQNDYNIMNSPFGRDVLKELSDECKKQGIVFCTYYSILDWYHPDYNTAGTYGGAGFKLPQGQKPDMDRYVTYMKNHLREIIQNYGPLGIIWFDGEWEKPWNYERGKDLYAYVKSLQDDIIINNRVGKARQGMAGTTKQDTANPGDYDTPEQRIGAFQNQRPWETCMTICRQWAWKPKDDMKSFKECIQTLVRVAGGDGNLLFNVGPMPDGRIEPRQVDRLKEMGQWLKKYGESIYETRGGPFKPGPWGASTHSGNTVYVHIFNWTDESVKLAPLPKKITSSSVLTGGSVQVIQTDEYIEIKVPPSGRDKVDTIIKLELDGPASQIAAVSSLLSGSVALDKKASASNVFRKMQVHGPDKAFDDDPDTRWATDAGTKQAWIEVDLAEPATVSSAMIDERTWDRVKKFQLQYKERNEWKTIVEGTTIGEKKHLKFNPVTARIFRLNILDATEGPTIWEIQLYPFK
jgi:alpha-L-fucosidase